MRPRSSGRCRPIGDAFKFVVIPSISAVTLATHSISLHMGLPDSCIGSGLNRVQFQTRSFAGHARRERLGCGASDPRRGDFSSQTGRGLEVMTARDTVKLL
jgi:hypothetical protein